MLTSNVQWDYQLSERLAQQELMSSMRNWLPISKPWESMGKKKGIRGYVRPTLDKLPGIKSDLVRLDDNWQEWRFPQLVEALKMGVTVRGTQSPWMATLGDVTREKTHCFTLNKRVESIGVVLTVSLKNIIW